MRFRHVYHLILYFNVLCTFSFASTSTTAITEEQHHVKVRVHAVGQGNCMSLEVQELGKPPEFMLVDIGSSSFAGEAHYRKNQETTSTSASTSKVPAPIIMDPLAEETSTPEKAPLPSSASPSKFLTPISIDLLAEEMTTPIKESVPSVIPQSEIKDFNFLDSQQPRRVVVETRKTVVEDFIRNMRTMLQSNKKLKSRKADCPISVKTVVITHPDWDHYGWLLELFNDPNDEIENLIFGGLPSHYFSQADDQKNFEKWLARRLKNGSEIFFPAIQYAALKPEDKGQPLKEILAQELAGVFALHTFSGDPNFKILPFAKALDFGRSVNISFLALNPIHFVRTSGKVMRSANPNDDNRDSIVIKISHKHSSVLLMGDATEATVNAIRDNYSKDLEFLKASVLLASHHGSAEEGCNDEKWIKDVAPQIVVISNGHNQGHPQEKAYKHFKNSPRLVQVSPHKVLVGRKKSIEEKKDKQSGRFKSNLHTTYAGIYSTLDSGTVTLTLLSESIKLQVETPSNKMEETISTSSKRHTLRKNIEEDTIEKVVAIETPEKIIFHSTAKSKHKGRPLRMPTSPLMKVVETAEDEASDEGALEEMELTSAGETAPAAIPSATSLTGVKSREHLRRGANKVVAPKAEGKSDLLKALSSQLEEALAQGKGDKKDSKKRSAVTTSTAKLKKGKAQESQTKEKRKQPRTEEKEESSSHDASSSSTADKRKTKHKGTRGERP